MSFYLKRSGTTTLPVALAVALSKNTNLQFKGIKTSKFLQFAATLKTRIWNRFQNALLANFSINPTPDNCAERYGLNLVKSENQVKIYPLTGIASIKGQRIDKKCTIYSKPADSLTT